MAALCFAKNLPQLQDLMSCLKEGGIPYLIIGKGSNLLVKDTGFEGVMIGLKGDFARVEKNAHEKNLLLAGGGVTVHDLLQYCTEEGLSGLEFLAGVPGTVGGSVTMNAGAWGMDVGSVIREIRLLTVEGDVIRKDRAELDFSYRRLAIPSGSVVLTAGFKREGGGAKNHSLKNCRLHEAAEGKTAFGIPERGLCVQESSQRLCGKTDRGGRTEGGTDWRSDDLGETCQLHRQYRGREGGGHIGLDGACSRESGEAIRDRT